MKDILKTIERIYDAAIDPGEWQGALADLCHTTNSVGFNIFMLDHFTGGVPFSTAIGIPDDLLNEYNAYYVTIDPGIEFFTKNPRLEFYYNHLHSSEPDMNRDEYYAWLEQAGGARYYLAKTFKQDQRFSIIATSQRDRKVGHAQSADFELMGQLSPHIQRAVRINRLFKDMDLRVAAAYDTLDGLPYGVCFLASDGAVVHMNTAARQVVARRDGLSLLEGKLRAENGADDKHLQTCVRQSLNPVMVTASNLVSVSRRGNEHAYSVQLLPLHTGFRLFSKRQSVAAVVIGDPSRPLRLKNQNLQVLYGLTEAEANIAIHLAVGKRPAEICEQEGISENTLKTHRNRLFTKVGVETQAQLVHLLNSL
ncbi:helix-turn-helix transcriptional regulator [Pacificispira sp.]|uniref:helix-turn-helix transcriptional regulator n=1 Tax=Pacificispira sp. TaxID=2888761 RepID=UPI003B519BAB